MYAAICPCTQRQTAPLGAVLGEQLAAKTVFAPKPSCGCSSRRFAIFATKDIIIYIYVILDVFLRTIYTRLT